MATFIGLIMNSKCQQTLIKNNNKNQITYIKKPSKIQSQDELLNKKPPSYISYLTS